MVRLFVAVTDKSWFDQLSASAPHDEVNFWQPSGTTQFRALRPGELFLFKLHAPNNFIAAAFSATRRSHRFPWRGMPSA
jgi:putative restriction endonuclease